MPKLLYVRWTLALCIALGAAGPTYASQWWVVLEHDAEGNSTLADADTISIVQPRNRVVLMHRFYRRTEGRMASAAIQYEVDCSGRRIREGRYVDYDGSYDVIREGDNTGQNDWRLVGSGTVGASIVHFTCTTPLARKAQYREIAATADYRAVGRFYADPLPIAPSAPSLARPIRPFVTATSMQAGQRYKLCALTAARQFSLSGETAPVAADAALAECQLSRRALAAAFASDRAMGSGGADIAINRFDDLLRRQLQLEVVRQRSKR